MTSKLYLSGLNDGDGSDGSFNPDLWNRALIAAPQATQTNVTFAAADQSADAPLGTQIIAPVSPTSFAAFTAGDIVVYRVGTGASALSGTATAVFIDEYSTTGILIQSIALPVSDSGSNQTLTATGSTTSEGFLALSNDGRYLIVPGYDVAPGSTTTTASNFRVIGLIGADGSVDTSRYLTDLGSGNIRGVASEDGSSFYIATSNVGIHYATSSATLSTHTSVTIETAVTNTRTVELFGGQLYDSAASSTFRVSTVGTGEPVTSGQTVTNLPGVSPGANSSPYAIYFADLSASVAGVDTLYVADDATAANGGGIQKYSLVSGSWVSNGTILDAGVRGLTASVSGGVVTLYATTASSLDKLVDSSGYGGSLTGSLVHLATAATNTAFRGVAFAPQAAGVTISINDVTQTEGDAGTTTFTFTVSLSGAAGAGGVTFDIATADGTALAGSDYVASSLTAQSIAQGNSSYQFSVTVNGDHLVEGNETFTVTLSNVSGATVADGQGQGTITNDDVAGTFSLAGDVSDSEAGTGLVFTVNRTGGSAGAATISYAVTSGSGAHPVDAADFGGTLPSGTVDFADGETSKTITITPSNDSDYESDETFTLTLSNPTAGSIGTATATGTVTNDDPAPPVGAFSLAGDSNALEGAGTISFTVNRSGGSSGAADVSYAVTGSGAHAADGTDFTGGTLPSGTVSFADGETSKTIDIQVSNDHDQESDETFTLTLSNPTNGASLGATTTATGTIQNDDIAGSFSLAGDQSGSENGGGMTFTVNRSGGSDGAVTLNYAVTGSGAHPANAADFGGALPSGTVSFADGETSKTITITPSDDSTYESDETFTLTLSSPTNGTIGTATATGTITNDEPVPPSLSISDVSVIEGDSGTTTLVYTVTASFPVPAGGLSVDYATADGSATAGSGDYVATSGTLNFAPGDTTATIMVTVNGDTLFERNETVIVNLSNPVNALIADGQGVGTIGNDDPVPPTAGLFSTDFAAFTATGGFAPGGVAGGLDSNVWRVVGLSDNPSPAYGFTAAGGGDFGRGLITGTTDVVTAGVYSASADHALIVQPTAAELEAGGFIEARIQNNSGATATSFDLVFDWAYRNNADRADNMQLAFSTDGINFVTVGAAGFTTPAAKDGVAASVFTDVHESVLLTGTVADGGYLYLRWTHASSAGSGSRDEVGIDNVGVTAHLSSDPTATISDISVAEGNSGTSLATFTITRSNGTGAASVDYSTADVTAVAGSDYVAKSGTVSFADGEFSKTVSIVINGDLAHEADETFTLNLSNASGFVTPVTRATGTIVNDDAGPIAIYDIQGLGHSSPFVGQSVTTTGIVTAVDSNGFYLQDPLGDGNTDSSDAVFVFTSTAPTVAIGDSISVTGTVAEFASNADSLSITEINSPTISVLSTGNSLPDAVVIGTDGRIVPSEVIDDDHLTSYDPAHDAIDFFESIEGMRVTVRTPSVVSDTDGNGNTWVVASNGANATGLNARGGLTLEPGDTQPEKIHIATDSGIDPSFTNPHWTEGDKLNDVTGVITYFSQTYQLIPTTVPVLAQDNSLARETTALHGDVDHLAIGTYNLENYDPNDHKEGQLASDLIFNLGGPDIIGVEEVQDDNGTGTGVLSATQNLTNLVNAMNALDPTANYQFVEIDPTAENASGGEPNGNIRNAFIYDANRVSYVPNSVQTISGVAFTNSRLPLVAQFVFNGQTITAIDMHSYSRGGSGADFGDTQPPAISGDDRRTAMGQAVRDWLDAHPQPHVAVMGDFNGYYYEGGLQALQNANANGPGLTNLAVALLPAEERYSYQFDGANELFDHILVSGDLATGASYDSVHLNSEYPANASRPTDHDPQVALVFVNAPAIARADDVTTAENVVLSSGNVFADNGHGADSDPESDAFSVIAVNGVAGNVGNQIQLASGALLTLNADGTFSYDPNHAFDATPTSYSGASNTPATDSFTYTLTGGATTTVTLSITGVDSDDRLLDTAGNDELIGGSGNDVYVISGGSDTIVELAGGGTDTVETSLGVYVLKAANVENLTGTSNAGQVLVGNDLGNRISGGTGNDQMQGGLGDDTYVVLNPGDTIVERAGEGTDTIETGLATYFLRAANVENLTGTSNAGQSLIGNAGDNVITGGLGNDELQGGLGNDTYVVRNAGDTIVEHAGEGNDTVMTSLATYFLRAANVENLVGTSNAGQVLIGSAADDHITGGTGNDQLYGGQGDDTYVLLNNGDTIVEFAGNGTDTVETGLAYYHLIAANVENLTGTSNSGQTLVGSGIDNVITGGGGNDVLDGGLGADILVGNGGADSFLFDTALGGGNVDTVQDFLSHSDHILLDNSVFTALSEGSLSSGAFVVGTAAQDANDRILYDNTTGDLYYDADGNGAGAAVLFATLQGHPTIVASDIVVI